MTGSRWFLLDSGARAPAFNMALDEALLEAMPRLGGPVLRFYSWSQPAASFGYFQKFANVARLTPLRPVVRRPTGGGIVPHDAYWTYSLCFPTSHEWYSLAAAESYFRIHAWLRAAFLQLEISTELAPEARKSLLGQCFAGYEKSDLLWRGNKIAGAAQRRRRDGLLIQGSVQPQRLPVQRAAWQNAMRDTAPFGPGMPCDVLRPDADLLRREGELAAMKYSQDAYNQRR